MVDYYDSADLSSKGSSARSNGLALVQNVDAINTEVYAAVRSHAFDDEDSEYVSSVALLVGARFRF